MVQQHTQAMIMQQLLASQINNTGSKKARELYIGNLAIGIVTEQMLRDFFNTAMQGLAPDQAAVPAVTNIWMAADQKYSFVEFRTEELATIAMSLDKVELCGRSINVGRPSGYQPGTGAGGMGMPGMGMGTPSIAALNPALSSMLGTANPMAALMGGAAAIPAAPAVPAIDPSATTVLKLVNMIKVAEFDKEDYDEVEQDVKDECSKSATVMSVTVPKPSGDGLEVKGLGAVFVHFADTAGSSKAFKMMNGRTFDGVKIEASYISEATYNNKDF